MIKQLILLVEDNPDDEALAILALRENGFTSDIVVAHDGEEALEILTGSKNIKIRPDLILLDLKLPKLSGIEVLKHIREQAETKHTPVVMLTTSLEDADIANSYDNGANSYIRKPVNYNDFVEQLGYVIKYWFICNKAI
ncbi:MAG: response regulator [Gammaproteobacteria bacterium]|nr:response regulator [Gammaproteobacteria bacterium]MDH5734873.1 response regulator [Gammaproteobacteria bacterium]